MVLQILKHTPTWVFALFFGLVALGFAQSRPRTVSRPMAAVIPGAMILLSFYGVLSAFGASTVGVAAWLAGVGLAALIRRFCVPGRGVTYSRITRSFHVSGSWRPLALMMGIFFTKYGVGVSLARSPSLAGAPLFVGGIGLLYGFLSGLFLAWTLLLWRIAKWTPATPAPSRSRA